MGTVATSCVAEAEDTTASVPLNFTGLFPMTELKLLPSIVTIVPATPCSGEKWLMTGELGTTKLVSEATVTSFTVAYIFPVATPCGTVTTNWVTEADATVATTFPNFTILSNGVGTKFEPVIVTLVPATPEIGVKEVITVEGSTTKSEFDRAVAPFTVTEIFPVTAPVGTVVTNWVVVAEVMADVILLNLTMLPAALLSKLEPVIVIVLPAGPVAGAKAAIAG